MSRGAESGEGREKKERRKETNCINTRRIVLFSDISKTAASGKAKEDNLLGGGSLYTRTQQPAAELNGG